MSCADPQQRLARAFILAVGFEFDALATILLEGMLEQQIFSLGIDRCALP